MTSAPPPTSPGERPFGANARIAIIAVVIVGLFFGVLFAWRTVRATPPPSSTPPPTAVAAAVVEPTDVPTVIEAVGSLRAVREVTLAPEVAGRITAIRFSAGQFVPAGATLVQLYDAPERADRAEAQSRAAFAATQRSRSQQLAPLGAEPHELLEQRRAEQDQANAAVRQLDARIAQKRVTAPFAGSLGLRRVNLGQYLNPGDAIATLTALDSLYVDFTVPQQQLAALRVGGVVQVTVDAWPGRTFTARVNAVEPRIGEDTRNVTVQATIANGDHALKPGMYVTARLELPPEHGVLTVPATAIQTSAAGDSVIVIRGPSPRRIGKAEIVAITTGRRFGDRVILKNGLRAGDMLVTEGQLRVRPGSDVTVVPPRAGGH